MSLPPTLVIPSSLLAPPLNKGARGFANDGIGFNGGEFKLRECWWHALLILLTNYKNVFSGPYLFLPDFPCCTQTSKQQADMTIAWEMKFLDFLRELARDVAKQNLLDFHVSSTSTKMN